MSHYSLITSVMLPAPREQAIRAVSDEEVKTAVLWEHLLCWTHRDPDLPAKDTLTVTDQQRYEFLVNSLVEDRMAPYCTQVSDQTEQELMDYTEEAREQYETDSADFIRLVDGRIAPRYSPEVYQRYAAIDGNIYEKDWGRLHRHKRTKRCKRMRLIPQYPMKKAYKSFQDFAEDYLGYSFVGDRCGSLFNPNGYWDHFQIGGRLPHCFLVPEDCASVVTGSYGVVPEEPPALNAPEGYRWVAGARKGDIAWEAHRQLHMEHLTEQFRKLKQWYRDGKLPPDIVALKLRKDGIYLMDRLLYSEGESLDDYLNRCGAAEAWKRPEYTYALLDDYGWVQVDDEDWPALDQSGRKPQIWEQVTAQFIENQLDDAILVAVDCHI